MQYSKEHLKTMVHAEFGGQTDWIMGNWKIENLQIADVAWIETFNIVFHFSISSFCIFY